MRDFSADFVLCASCSPFALQFLYVCLNQTVYLIVTPTKISDNDIRLGSVFFIGISDRKTQGVWKTTASDYRCDVTFTNWEGHEPSNGRGEDCAVTKKSSNDKWRDRQCTSAYPFLCQLYE